jgi:NAD(P)-dependent dehydrogenase (short-subunit alcohol dehydrogenase family)
MQRVAIITGASQGLGLALANALADDGWSLVLDARRTDRLDAAAAQVANRLRPEAQVIARPGDIADARHRADLVADARQLGEVRLVVNNASTLGASPLPPLDQLAADVFHRIFDVNVVAPLALLRELATDLRPGATIVQITSDAAVEPYPGWGGYGASKAALEHASRVVAVEHPEWRVLVVDPGDMRTEMHQDAFPGDDISDRPLPGASAAGIVALVERGRPSGRYHAKEGM